MRDVKVVFLDVQVYDEAKIVVLKSPGESDRSDFKL